jgi:ribosomal protein S1
MTKHQTTRTAGSNLEQLLQEYSYRRPERGDFLEAEVMQIDRDRILVDLGAKTDAVVTPSELRQTDPDIVEDLDVGDLVQVYVLRPPSLLHKPRVSIQRGQEKQDWDRAKQLEESGEVVALEVTGRNKGGLLVRFGRLEGFVPASLFPAVSRMPSRKLAEELKESLIGEQIYLNVIEAKPRRKKLILSARENREAIAARRLEELEPGEAVNGYVVNLVEFGAFIDLLGIDGLLHISELEYGNTEDPADVFTIGEKVEVLVLSLDHEQQRVSLSRKALVDPIEDLATIAA